MLFCDIVLGSYILLCDHYTQAIYVAAAAVRILTNLLYADDPDVPHVHHRNFLKENVVFKEVM